MDNFFEIPFSREDVLLWDLITIRLCRHVTVLELPGWDSSRGVEAEIAYAKFCRYNWTSLNGAAVVDMLTSPGCLQELEKLTYFTETGT